MQGPTSCADTAAWITTPAYQQRLLQQGQQQQEGCIAVMVALFACCRVAGPAAGNLPGACWRAAAHTVATAVLKRRQAAPQELV